MINYRLLRKLAIALVGYVGVLVLTVTSVAQADQSTGKLREKVQSNGDVTLSWESRAGLQVHIDAPLLIATVGKSKQILSVNLASHSSKDNKAVFDYDPVRYSHLSRPKS